MDLVEDDVGAIELDVMAGAPSVAVVDGTVVVVASAATGVPVRTALTTSRIAWPDWAAVACCSMSMSWSAFASVR